MATKPPVPIRVVNEAKSRSGGKAAPAKSLDHLGPTPGVNGRLPNRSTTTSARPAPTPGRPASTPAATAPGAAASTNNGPAPFLTPAQENTWQQYQTGYQGKVQALEQKLSAAGATTQANLAAAQKTHDVGYDNTNQALAARGLFQSSIRDGDLNDLDVTLAARQNLLNTNLRTLTLNTNTSLGTLGADYGWTNNYYNSLAVGNAVASDPGVAGATTTPSSTGGTNTPTAVKPQAAGAPVPISSSVQPRSSSPAKPAAPKLTDSLGRTPGVNGMGAAPAGLAAGLARGLVGSPK